MPNEKPKIKLSKTSLLITIALNVISISILVVLTIINSYSYSELYMSKSISEIVHVADNYSSYTYDQLDTRSSFVNVLEQLLDDQNPTYEESKTTTSLFNKIISNVYFELINTETYVGYATKPDGSVVDVDYSSTNYASFQNSLLKYNDQIIFNASSQFTSKTCTQMCLAVFDKIALPLIPGGETFNYYLLCTTDISTWLNNTVWQTDYSNLASGIMDADGVYLIKTSITQSNNFYKYLNNVEKLPLDTCNALKKEITTSNTFGTFVATGDRGIEYTYIYEKVNDEFGWYAINYLPTANLMNTNSNGEITNIIIITVVFVFLLFFNLAAYTLMNRRIRITAEKLYIADNAKSIFLGKMSHDLRTPMNAILLISELGENESTSQESKNYFTQIHSSGHYMLGIINDTLETSRIETGHITLANEPVNAEQYFKETYLIAIAPTLSKKMNITLKKDGDSNVFIALDKTRVQQILLNIVSNAIKYTPEEGNIDISVKYEPSDKYLKCTFIIKDDGQGMSEEFMSHLYEPYNQENPNSGIGTGLGLYITKSLVDVMDGFIDIQSKKNVGTTVTLVLSFPRLNEGSEHKELSLEQIAKLKNKRILIVDDQPINCRILQAILKKNGISSDTACDGKDALQKLTNSRKNYFNAVIMDIRMPVMDGLECSRKIRENRRKDIKDIYIVALSANAFDEDIIISKKAGMNDHLSKPVEITNLLWCLYNHFEGGNNHG